MELSENQIAELYQFTKDHYVDWYDLQTELVDHLANDIEEICSKSPNLSFEKARDISFKKFGIFGFGNIVEQKQKSLNKQYWKDIVKEFVKFFRLPKILITIFFCVGTYYLFSMFNNGYFIFTLLGLTMGVYPFYKLFLYNRKVNRRNKTTNKSWLIDGVVLQSGIAPFLILCPYTTIFELFFKPNFTPNQLIFFSITFVLFNLFFYVSTEIVRPNMQQKMVKLFPEYELV